jgi:hypothetical protein
MTLTQALLLAYFANLGIALGAGLYEARIVVPLWERSFPRGFSEIETGRRFWAFVTTVPLTCLCLASLIVAFRGAEMGKSLWLFSAIIVFVERLLTFGYFIPTILRFQNSKGGSEQKQSFQTWKKANGFRNLLTLAGLIFALCALTLSSVRTT